MKALKLPTASATGTWKQPPMVHTPSDVKDLQEILTPCSKFPEPIRPVGSKSAATACIHATGGTVIETSGFDEIVDIADESVTVQPGMNLNTLRSALAEHGLELVGAHQTGNRTVGGAVSSVCMGPSMPGEGAMLSSHVLKFKVVTPQGKLLEVSDSRPQLMNAYRLSYGVLGVVVEVTLKVRPIQSFSVNYRRCTFDQMSAAIPKLVNAPIGLKFNAWPFKDHIYVEVRRFDSSRKGGRKSAWKLKDWGESVVLPKIADSVGKMFSNGRIRYGLIDGLTEATQKLMNNPLVRTGSQPVLHTGEHGNLNDPGVSRYTTWLFPASSFPKTLRHYQSFCKRHYKLTGFRCDLPTVGFRVNRDRSALLSPSFNEPMFALRPSVSNADHDWEDFVMEFAEFAHLHHGMPIFNQTKSASVKHVEKAFESRLEFFRKIRRQLDPEDRLMNPFFMQYLQ